MYIYMYAYVLMYVCRYVLMYVFVMDGNSTYMPSVMNINFINLY